MGACGGSSTDTNGGAPPSNEAGADAPADPSADGAPPTPPPDATAADGGGEGGATTKQVACAPNNAKPAHSTDVVVDVTVTFDPASGTFSAPATCDYRCDATYCRDGSTCVTGKTVACDASTKPAHSTSVAGDVSVTCQADGTFTAPAACAYQCDASYCRDGSACVTSKNVACAPPTNNPAHSSSVSASVPVACQANGTFAAPSTCAYACSAGYTATSGGAACCADPSATGTCDPRIYLFPSPTTLAPNLGGRSGADALCADYLKGHPDLACTKVHAFLSVSSTDDIRSMPTNYGAPTNLPIYLSDTTTRVAASWSALMSGSIEHSLGAVVPGTYWTGSGGDGSVLQTCAGWTVANATDGGTEGNPAAIDAKWLWQGGFRCDVAKFYMMCACW